MSCRALPALRTTLLALLLAAPVARAQEGPALYVQLNYMKATSPDYEQVESTIWKPIHEERIRRGLLRGWALYGVRFGDRSDYDYITVNLFDDLADVDGWAASFEEIVESAHPDRTMDEVMRSLSAREPVRSELWVLRETLEVQQAAGWAPYVFVALMDVPPAGAAEYLRLEREIWKPLHQLSVNRGESIGWSVYELMMPGGSSYPYNFVAVNAYDRLRDPPAYAELIAEAHPGRSVDEISASTLQARDMVRSAMWSLIDGTP